MKQIDKNSDKNRNSKELDTIFDRCSCNGFMIFEENGKTEKLTATNSSFADKSNQDIKWLVYSSQQSFMSIARS